MVRYAASWLGAAAWFLGAAPPSFPNIFAKAISASADYNFGTLKKAQVLGHARMLQAGDRRVARFRLGLDPVADLQELFKENA